MSYTLRVKGGFEAAHQLSSEFGKCSRLHGHSARYEVYIEVRNLCDDGVIIDAKEITSSIDILDHEFLNEIIENPTAENIAEWIALAVKEKLEKRYKEEDILELSIKVKETDNIEAGYKAKG